jgi:CRP-like cAMP-binding protein
MTRSQSDLLEGLVPDDAVELMALGTRIPVPLGSELFRLGDPATSVFVIERGRIALAMPMQVFGRAEDVLIEERTAGEALGWSALIPPHRFTLKAGAVLDSEVIGIPRDALLEFFKAHPAIGYVVTRNVAEIIGQRLQVFQAMWLREMQRAIELRHTPMRVAP